MYSLYFSTSRFYYKINMKEDIQKESTFEYINQNI